MFISKHKLVSTVTSPIKALIYFEDSYIPHKKVTVTRAHTSLCL